MQSLHRAGCPACGIWLALSPQIPWTGGTASLRTQRVYFRQQKTDHHPLGWGVPCTGQARAGAPWSGRPAEGPNQLTEHHGHAGHGVSPRGPLHLAGLERLAPAGEPWACPAPCCTGKGEEKTAPSAGAACCALGPTAWLPCWRGACSWAPPASPGSSGPSARTPSSAYSPAALRPPSSWAPRSPAAWDRNPPPRHLLEPSPCQPGQRCPGEPIPRRAPASSPAQSSTIDRHSSGSLRGQGARWLPKSSPPPLRK